jgi:hypothetical protein
MDLVAQLRVAPAVLTGVVRRALGEPDAEIDAWHAEAIHGPIGSGFTVGVYRVTGTARVRARPAPWSVVLKILRHPDGPRIYDDPGGANYWRREACAYESGLLDDLPAGIRAPRCFAAVPQPDQSVMLWLEDVPGRYHDPWPVARYTATARRLGQFNGAYLAGRPLPSYPWLLREPARSWVASQAAYVRLAERPETWHDPLLRRAFPIPVADRLLRLWREQETFLGALARLPRTFCHYDAGRHNLLPRPGGEHDCTVAVDWEYAAIAAVGEEAGLLVSTPPPLDATSPADLLSLYERVLDGYLDGLADAGWSGDPRVVRLGFTAGAALRMVFRMTTLRAVLEPARREREEQRWGRPIAELLPARAALTYALLDLADEARALIGTADGGAS